MLAATALAPRAALAQDPADPGGLPPVGETVSAGELDSAARRPYWSGGLYRPFLSSVLEVGFFYVRAQLAAGYGQPHWRWIGVETQARTSGAGAAEYFGLRGALPFAELRTGIRYQLSTDQAMLEPKENYTRDDIRKPDSPRSRYFALEGELTGSAPLLGGTLFGAASAYMITGVPDDYLVFEDALHVVVDPPWLWRVRLGHVLKFGAAGGLRVGMAAEVIGVPERDALIVRFGPQLAVVLTHHLDAVASIMAVAASPDSLRLLGAEIGQFGLRYKWATGDQFPEFP